MLRLIEGGKSGEGTTTPLEEAVEAYLSERFDDADTAMARLDRWSKQRIAGENRAKLALVREASDPVEHCYQDLIREIDSEAEAGIFLAAPAARAATLCRLSGETGVSGRLYQQMPRIASRLFADELLHSNENLDLVWVGIEARYDRANLDAEVSELILMHLLEAEESAADMSDALRALLYAFHEDLARRRSTLPPILNERAARHLARMVAKLTERAGNYAARIQEIGRRAGTA